MSVAQAAGALGVGAQTVRRMIDKGTLHPLPRATEGRGSEPFKLERREVMRVKRALAVVPPVRHRDPTTGELSARRSPVSAADAPSAPRRAGGGRRAT